MLDNCSRKDKIILREQKDEKNTRGQKSLCHKLISRNVTFKSQKHKRSIGQIPI